MPGQGHGNSFWDDGTDKNSNCSLPEIARNPAKMRTLISKCSGSIFETQEDISGERVEALL